MNKFSDAFDAARTAIKSDDFAGTVKTMQPKLKQLLASGGPDAAQAEQLENLRVALNKETYDLISKEHMSRGEAFAKPVIDAAGTAAKKQERAATVKMLRHLHHVTSAGGQQVWVYNPPKAYSKWIFDEVAGATDTVLETVMEKMDPVFSSDQTAVMASAVHTARAIALDVVAKLGSPDDAVKAVVRRYFGATATTADELTATMTKLSGGYQRIANACNGCTIVLSDDPVDRARPIYMDTFALIYNTEAMNVIYMEHLWLEKAKEAPSNASALNRCARTLLHELSHKMVKTEDIVYGPSGLKPQGSSCLTPEYALHNADSWAYFAMDVLGKLTGQDKTNGDTACTEILKAPRNTLVTA